MKMHELSVKRPVAVTMAVMIFFVLGLFSVTRLSIDMMPDMNLPIIAVVTQYNGVAPAEIENLVTIPIENAISAVSGVKSTSSTSSEGSSMVMAEFSSDIDIDIAAQDVKERLDLISSMLPSDCDDPMTVKFDPSMMPVAYFSFTVNGMNMTETKKYFEDDLQRKIEAIDGVASVSVSGGTDREIQVAADTNKLFGYNLTLEQLVSAVASENRNMPGGSVDAGNKSLNVRSVGKFDSIDEIKQVPILTTTGQVILLRDVADVQDTYTEPENYARLNGSESLSIQVQKQSGANTVKVVNAITDALDGMQKTNPNIHYEMTFEQASYISSAIGSVAESAVLGAILAVLILFLFLGSLRSSLIIGITMPVSICTTFIGMYFANMTLNVVSLGGLALGVGMLVDNAVVVLENIYRRRSALKEDSVTAATKGTGEVVGAVVASVLTTCIVYVPILFIDGLMVTMFRQLAFAIIFSQVASLITTFLLIPMLSAKVKNIENTNRFKAALLKPFNIALAWLYKGYERLLRFSLSHRKTVVFTILSMFCASVMVLGVIGMELMPSSDAGSMTISISAPLGTKLNDTNQLSQQIETKIQENPYVQTVFSTVAGGSMLGSGNTNEASIMVTLTDKKDRRGISTADVVEMLREELGNIAGAQISIEATSSTGMSMGSSDGISFSLSGDDLTALEQYANSAVEVLKEIEGVREAETSISDTKTEARIYVDREKASRYGLTTASAASMIRSSLSGTVASQFTDSGKEYDIRIQLPDSYTDSYEDLQNIKIRSGHGQWITVNDIAKLTMEQGYSSISRQNQKRVVTVSAQLYGTDMTTATAEFTERMKSIPAPEGCTLEASGNYETMMESMVLLLLAIIIGILLMYMVMAAQFESFTQPLIVMGAVPMALIGVVIVLLLDRNPLNIISCIGFLMLSGMIVNNAIILIDFINTTTKEGIIQDRTEIIVKSGLTRLRPVLMTTITSILGFLPMVMSSAEGSEMMRPLAIVLLGGLSFGTILTLIFVPVLYTYMDDRKLQRAKKKASRAAKKSGISL